jgi:hypothetical protein
MTFENGSFTVKFNGTLDVLYVLFSGDGTVIVGAIVSTVKVIVLEKAAQKGM